MLERIRVAIIYLLMYYAEYFLESVLDLRHIERRQSAPLTQYYDLEDTMHLQCRCIRHNGHRLTRGGGRCGQPFDK